MKKGLIALIILAVAGLGICFWVTRMGQRKPAVALTGRAAAPGLASFVPESTAVFADFVDLGKIKSAIVASRYYERLTSTAFWRREIAPSGSDFQEAIQHVSVRLGVKLSPELIWGLLGREFAVALARPDPKSPWALMAISRIPEGKVMQSVLETIISALKANGFKVSESKYSGRTIKTVAKGDKNVLALCRLPGLLAMASDLSLLKSSIDLVRGSSKASLASVEDYRAIAARLKPGHFCELYVDLDTYLKAPFELLSRMTGGLASIPAGQGVPTVSGETLWRGYVRGGVVFDGYTVLDLAKTDPKIAQMYGKYRPEKLAILTLIPKRALAAMALNSIDAKQMYEIALGSITSQNPIGAAVLSGYLGQLQEQTGVSLQEDILPLLGPDMACYFAGLDFSQALSMPQIGFACSSADPKKLLALFPKLGEYVLSFAKDKALKTKHLARKYKGYEVNEVRLQTPLGSVTLAAAAVDRYFCVGLSGGQVDRMIDCLGGEAEHLGAGKLYSSMASAFPKLSNQIVFVDIQGLWEQTRLAIERYSAGGAKEPVEFVDALIGPLKGLYATTIYSGEGIEESHFLARIEAE